MDSLEDAHRRRTGLTVGVFILGVTSAVLALVPVGAFLQGSGDLFLDPLNDVGFFGFSILVWCVLIVSLVRLLRVRKEIRTLEGL